MKLKETRLKKKMTSKKDEHTLLPKTICMVDIRKKEAGEVSQHVFYEKLDNITQKQMDGMFYRLKVKKIDKNNIYTYLSKLTLLKIIVYVVLHLQICFSIISSFSEFVVVARFGNGCNGCKASRMQLY